MPLYWKTGHTETGACACTKGYVHRTLAYDDTNGARIIKTLHCDDCASRYVEHEYVVDHWRGVPGEYFDKAMPEVVWFLRTSYDNYRRLQSELKEASSRAEIESTEYLRRVYGVAWRSLFVGMKRTKKALWEKLTGLNLIRCGYPSFCSIVGETPIDEYVENYLRPSYAYAVFAALSVKDEEYIRIATSMRALRDSCSEASSVMHRDSFR